MSALTALQMMLLIPLLGALGILLCHRWPNLREGVTLLTAISLFACAIGVLGDVRAGNTPLLRLAEPLPGIVLGLRAEPLGILFALLASGLWIVTSVYSIGYMRAKREQKIAT